MALMNPQDPDSGWSAWDYARAVLHTLNDIKEGAGQDTDNPVTRVRQGFVIATDASGNGSADLLLPPGVAWNLLAYAWQVTPDPGGIGYIAFYRDAEQGTGLVKVDAAAALLDDSFNPEGHFIPEQSRLLVVARGLPANSNVAGNLTAKGVLNGHPRYTDTSGA